jgi:hypothetical protein
MDFTKPRITLGLLRLALIVLVGLSAISNAPPTAAQSKCWTTVGSAGTVDEADTGIVSLALNNVTIKPTLSNATLERPLQHRGDGRIVWRRSHRHGDPLRR